jgi:hypothetical protein
MVADTLSHMRADPGHPSRIAAAATTEQVPNSTSPLSESVLAQWRQAVADGVPPRADSPPRTSRREQLAEVAEQPFVRRALELFDIPAGQFRYLPPEGETN